MSRTQSTSPPYIRVLVAIIWPIAAAAVVGAFFNSLSTVVESASGFAATSGPLLLGLGLASLYSGLRWYDADGLSFRSGRPMLSGLGFAFLGWLGLLLARFAAIDLNPEAVVSNLGITFLFLLIFEAFCVQLWTFGLLFRVFADWLNPLSAAILSGVIFGLTAYLLFGESYASRIGILYFAVFGVLYGIIRLRSGSFIGVVLVQAIQTLTVWHVLPPVEPVTMDQLAWLYGISGLVNLVVLWRLWPKFVSDYRV